MKTPRLRTRRAAIEVDAQALRYLARIAATQGVLNAGEELLGPYPLRLPHRLMVVVGQRETAEEVLHGVR